MVRRRTIIAAIGLLLLGALGVAGAGTPGTTTWAGNYRVLDLGGGVHNPQVMVAWGTATSATLYCGVTSGPHFPPQVGDQSAWVPAWSGAQPPSTMFALTCDTDAILVATGAQPAVADLSIMGGAVSTSSATATSGTSTATSSPTPIPPTRTPAPVTATTSPTTIPTATMPPMEGMTDGGNTCGNLSDDPKAIDQNGVPLNRWAPGLRMGCGFGGFENGDDPNPPGSHLPAPRPFDFDRAVVSNESAFGFKVYYRTGSEAPDGYQGANGCGDVRVILHQGGSVHGFVTEFHTYQFATDVCDAAGGHHIIDVAGRIDTGPLFQRHLGDAARPEGPNRTTADTLSCDGATTWVCATVWYSFFNYALPGASNTGWSHMGFLVENPISLYDVNSPNTIHPGPGNGTTTMLRDNQWYVPAHTVADWWALFNPATQINEVVPAGTAGAWPMHVDTFFDNVETLEPSYGVDHYHPIAGIVYPD